MSDDIALPPPEPADEPADEPTPEAVAAVAAENERLRAENEKLRTDRTSARLHLAGRVGRSTAVVLLLLIATLLALLSPPVVWARNELLNTNRYVTNLAPLASDPGVQAGVIKLVDQQINAHLDISDLLDSVLPPKLDQLSGPIESGLQTFVNAVVTKFVQSSAFQTLWEGVNRLAHSQIVAILTGKGSAVQSVSVRNGVLQLDLSAVVTQVKQQLVNAGLTVAKNIPPIGATIELAQVKGLEKARHAVRLLDSAANWLPWLALLFFAGAIAAAQRRRKRLITSAICVAAAMVVLRLGIAIGRSIYLHNLPGLYFTQDTSGRVYDTVLRFLVDGIRIIFVVALLVILVAVLFGPARPAVRLRQSVRAAPGWLGTRLPNSAFSRAMAQWAKAITWTILGLAGLIVVLWGQAGWAFVLTIAIVAAVLVLAVQALARAGTPHSVGAFTPPG